MQSVILNLKQPRPHPICHHKPQPIGIHSTNPRRYLRQTLIDIPLPRCTTGHLPSLFLELVHRVVLIGQHFDENIGGVRIVLKDLGAVEFLDDIKNSLAAPGAA